MSQEIAMAKAETLPSTCYASEDEDDNIEFHSAGIDSNDGVEDEARFHSYDEPQLASKALFFQS